MSGYRKWVRRLLPALLALFMLPTLSALPARAETAVTLETRDPCVGRKTVLTVASDRTDCFSYVLMHGAKTLGSADEVKESRLGFVPQEEGEYLLRVIPQGHEEETVHFVFTVRAADDEEPGFVLYGQKDGTWAHVPYGSSTLAYSGCAIFALSHALQRLGYTGEDIAPAALAERYRSYLGINGTRNGAMIARAAKDFGFRTKSTLYTTPGGIRKKLTEGCVFSFGIVDQHIALADGLSEDGTMCHIIDSSPSSTFRYITGVSPSVLDEKTGEYVPAGKPTDIPGVCYCLLSNDYDGAEYWLPITYLAGRGLRLIEPGKKK